MITLQRVTHFMDQAGLSWFVPLIRFLAGEDPREQLKAMWLVMGVPVIAVVLFLSLWDAAAHGVQTSLGSLPGPKQVWGEFFNLIESHKAEREKAAAFYARQEQ